MRILTTNGWSNPVHTGPNVFNFIGFHAFRIYVQQSGDFIALQIVN